MDHKHVLRFLEMIAITSTLAVIGLCISTASADELSSKDLIDFMRTNDAHFDRAIIKLQYTDFSKAPPPKPKLNIRSPTGRFATDVQSKQEKKPVEFEYFTRHDDSIDAKDLPDPKKLFYFGSMHAAEIREGVISTPSDKLTPQESEWLRLLVERKLTVSRKKKPTTESTTATPATPEAVSEIMAIQGRDIVVIHDNDSKKVSPRKFSSVGGRTEMMNSYFTDASQSQLEWLKDSRQLSVPLDSYQELALWRLFAMGVGFGSRIKQLEILNTEGGISDCDAVLEIWPGLPTSARLQIDSNGIVRLAKIDAGITNIIVETTGTRDLLPACKAAADGTFSRKYKSTTARHSLEFRLSLTSVDFNIQPDTFSAMADFTPPDGERVSNVSPPLAPPKTPGKLIAMMTANDHQLDRVRVRCIFTERTNSRPMMSPLRSIQDEKERTRLKKAFVPTIEHDHTVDQLPDAALVLDFAKKHSQEIQDGTISPTSNLTEAHAKLLQLLIEKRIKVGLRLHEPETSSAPPAPRLFAIRGRDVILIHDPLREVDLTRKYSSISGEESFAILERSGPNGSLEWMVDSVPSTRDFGTEQFSVLCHVFAMGVGFGSRLRELEIVNVDDGLTHCEGSLEIWPGRLNKTRLVIDTQQIVRRAEIQCEDSTITIETKAVKQFSPAFRAATEGHFRWAEDKPSQYTKERFDLSVTSIEFALSDEQFHTLDRSVPPPDEKVTRVLHQRPVSQRCQKTPVTMRFDVAAVIGLNLLVVTLSVLSAGRTSVARQNMG